MFNFIWLDIDSSWQTSGSKWLDRFCDSTLTRLDQVMTRLWLDSKNIQMTLTRLWLEGLVTRLVTRQIWLVHITAGYSCTDLFNRFIITTNVEHWQHCIYFRQRLHFVYHGIVLCFHVTWVMIWASFHLIQEQLLVQWLFIFFTSAFSSLNSSWFSISTKKLMTIMIVCNIITKLFCKRSEIFNFIEWRGMLSSLCTLNMKHLLNLEYK